MSLDLRWKLILTGVFGLAFLIDSLPCTEVFSEYFSYRRRLAVEDSGGFGERTAGRLDARRRGGIGPGAGARSDSGGKCRGDG